MSIPQSKELWWYGKRRVEVMSAGANETTYKVLRTQETRTQETATFMRFARRITDPDARTQPELEYSAERALWVTLFASHIRRNTPKPQKAADDDYKAWNGNVPSDLWRLREEFLQATILQAVLDSGLFGISAVPEAVEQAYSQYERRCIPDIVPHTND